LRQFDIPDRRIFTAPNAMDLRFFAESSRRARQNPEAIRREFDLPDRYFLNAGRFVAVKGVLDLLEAYANLDATIRSSVGLVLAGDGVLKEQLARRAAQIRPGAVRFPGFMQKDRLPELYALADAFVFPTLSDTWGFVVNEAMACGLPVITTDVAGCVADLVQDGWNGCVVPAGDVSRLSWSLSKLATDDPLRRLMGERSTERIAGYSPAAWATGVAEAVAATNKRGGE
jgi:glycosyltransferase involved in cell wall biosynthesis